MLILVDNRLLTKDREKTYLTAQADAADTALTVKAVDTNSMADNDYLIVGEIGSENAEIMQVAATVVDGTSLTIDRSGAAGGLRYDHAVNEPVYRIDFNQVEFSRSATDDSSSVAVLATNEIQPDDINTRYEDTANTTGFAFVRFKNQTDSTFSEYSDGIPYAGQSARSLAKMRRRVRTLLSEGNEQAVAEFISDEDIDEALNDKQRDIAHERLWSFYESERSLSTVADQFAYNVSDKMKVGTIHSCSVRTQPLAFVNRNRWNRLHWDTDTSGADPSHFSVWDEQVKLYQRPSAAAASTAINDGAGITATDTSVTVDDTSGFQRGDYYRFIINSEVIYATAATTTTFTGLLRGQEGTTAAAHVDDDTITERDIVYTGQDEPDDLVDQNDETKIPEPIALCLGAAADLALKLDKETLHDRLILRYDREMDKLRERFTVKVTGQFSAVRDSRGVVRDHAHIRNPNDFPENLS